jgi:DNA-binding PadR family transcriptional regulator
VQRLLEKGLILEIEDRPDPEEDDQRRRYYRISELGLAVAKAEASRFAELVQMARSAGLVPKKA